MSIEASTGAIRREGSLLEPFVPAIVRRRIAAEGPAIIRPATDCSKGAILLADLTGFSSLAEGFARRGPRGAEDLGAVLNFFCGHLIDLVDVHGGEVLNFAGDAALALWPIDEDGPSFAVRRAAQCALAVREVFRTAVAPSGVRLSLRCGLGLGEVWYANVGGVAGRWEFLVAGDPLTQAVEAMAAASMDDIAVSSAAWDILAPCADGKRIGSTMRLQAVIEPVPLAPAAVIALGSETESLLRAYVPPSVQARVDARQSEWLAEFRRVTTLFIKLGALDCGARDGLDQLQRAAVAVQTAVYRYGGSVNQLLVDDKGTVVVCGWGLALHAHGDDQVRAMRAALEADRGLQEIGLNASFGLATGDVFTGLLGNGKRCAYTMIGDVVNVAARLMQASDDGILCDAATCEAANKRIAFEPLPSIEVKGRERHVEVFRAVQLSADSSEEIIGRVGERRMLRDRLEALVSGGSGGIVVLEGDPGIGKSRLVADLVDRAVAKGVRTIVATGDAIERSAPYHVWCALFENLLGLEGLTAREDAQQRIARLLESNQRLVPFAPLLNPILRLAFQQTEQSERVPPRGRALFTRDLLVHLFRCASGDRPTLLVLEDAHWLDSASWALAESIQQQLRDTLLVVAMRPLKQDEQPAELKRMTDRKGTLLLRLAGLAPDEARRLVCQRLRSRQVSEPVAHLIRDMAEGHPFFTEELAYALRDRGQIEIEGGVCRFSAAAAKNTVELPNTVQVVVSSRIDQLTLPQQLTLKVASVFGRSFDLVGLRAIYPIEIQPEELERHADALVERDLVQFTAPDPVATYAFKHAILQDVAYNLLPYTLRRQLHAAAASWYERHHPEDTSPIYPLLAHHWSRAEVGERAVWYLDRAGKQALSRHANEEALRFYNEAVEADEKFAPVLATDAPVSIARRTIPARDVRRIYWERRLGDASANLCRWEDGRRHFRNVLALMGRQFPTSNRQFAIGIGREIAAQSLRRLAPRLFGRSSSDATTDLLRQAVSSYERIGSISYQQGQTNPALYSLVAGLNLAERLGPTMGLALVYADVANVLALIPVRRLARMYHRMATEIASRLDDPVMASRIRARAAMYRAGIGDWMACSDLEAALPHFDRIGDSYVWEEITSVRGRVAQLRGEFDLAARLGAEIRQRGASTGAVLHEVWGIVTETWANLYLGRLETALDGARAGLRLMPAAGASDWLVRLDFLGATALAHVWRDQFDDAYQTVQQMMEAMAGLPRLGYFAVLALGAAAEASLAIREHGGSSNRAVEASTQARQICGRIESYARISPPAIAHALLWRGCAEWLDGHPEKAHGIWQRCLSETERFGLPYEAARVRYEIGRRLPPGDSRRRVHLAQAEEGFRRLKAVTHVKRASAALRAG